MCRYMYFVMIGMSPIRGDMRSSQLNSPRELPRLGEYVPTWIDVLAPIDVRVGKLIERWICLLIHCHSASADVLCDGVTAAGWRERLRLLVCEQQQTDEVPLLGVRA